MKESESIARSSPRKPWSETRNGRIAAAGGVLGLFVLVFWLAMKSKQIAAAAATPGLVVEDQYLSFGEVWEDPAFVWRLPISNRLDQDIEIKRFHKSRACAQIEPKSLMIPAGQTREVRLTLNLAQGCTNEASLPVRDFEVGIAAEVPMSRLSFQAVRWSIRGSIRKPLLLSEPEIVYPHALLRGEPFSIRKITVTPQIPILELEAHCQPDVASVQVTRPGEGQEGAWEVSVLPLSKKLPVAPFTFDILLQPIGQRAGKLPATRIPVKTRIVEDVQASPPDILLGAMSVGEKGNGVVTLKSSRGEPFHIEKIEMPSGASVQPIESRLSGRAFQIVQLVSKEGNVRELIRFIIKTANGERITIPVGVVYYGTKVAEGLPHR